MILNNKWMKVLIISIVAIFFLSTLILFVNRTYIISAEGSEGSEYINIKFNSDTPTRNTFSCLIRKALGSVAEACFPEVSSDFILFGHALGSGAEVLGTSRNEEINSRQELTLIVQANVPDYSLEYGGTKPFSKDKPRSGDAFVYLQGLFGSVFPDKPVSTHVVLDTWIPIQLKRISLYTNGPVTSVAKPGDRVYLLVETDRELREAPSIRFYVSSSDGSDISLGDPVVQKKKGYIYEASLVLSGNIPSGDLKFELYNVIDKESRGLDGIVSTTADQSSVRIQSK